MEFVVTGVPSYLLAIAATAAIYAILAIGLNVIWGFGGMINLGMVGFFAVGAYVSALLTVDFGWPIWAGMIAGSIAAGLISLPLTLATLRLRGDYLAIVTLGFAELVRLVANNEIWLTRGADGVSNVPGPWRAELAAGMYNLVFCLVAVACLALVYVVAERVRASAYGRSLRAIREDEDVAAVAGKPVVFFKLEAFTLGATILGFAGALFVHFTSYISPDNVRPLLTIYIFLALTLGGTANNKGAILGAFVVMAILEGTRFMAQDIGGLSIVQKAALREMLIGLLLIVVMRLRPQGLIPEPLPRHKP